MKYLNYTLLTVCVLSIICCTEHKPINNYALYGNTFIKIDQEDFEIPSTWKPYDLCNDAFQIHLPDYMHVSTVDQYPDDKNPQKITIIFNYNDTTQQHRYHYGRVGIDYYLAGNNNLGSAHDHLQQAEQEELFKPILSSALRGGKISDTYSVPEGKIINGPFYDRYFLKSMGLAYDVFYRRKGNTGEGPVSCHIFFMQNKTECTTITVAYHDRDSLMFNDLFKVVKTFKWNNIH